MSSISPTRALVCALTTMALVGKILAFCELVGQIEFYSYQRAAAMRIIESLLLNDGDVITCLFSRQSGKSNMLAVVVLGLTIIVPVLARAFPDDERLNRLAQLRIGIFGPNQESTGPIYERLRVMAESEHVQEIVQDPEISTHLTQSRGDSISWSLGSYVKAKTASENAFVEGGTYHLILIDEAQKVGSAKVRKEIAPMLAATNGTMVKIGTAWMSRGGFHSDIQTNILIERQGGKTNHFEFNYEVVIREKRVLYDRQKVSYEKYQQQLGDMVAGRRKEPPDENLRSKPADTSHLAYEKWVQGEIRRLGGTHSEEFKMNFLLLWQESSQIAFTDDEILRGAVPSLEVQISVRRGILTAGLDFAKTFDATVLTITEIDFAVPIAETDISHRQAAPTDTHFTKQILNWVELQGSFEKIQYGRIVEACAQYNIRRLIGDATGMGDPIMERLAVLLAPLEIEVVPFVYGSQSKDYLFKYYLQEFKAGRVRYPSGPHTRDTPEYRHFVEQHGDLVREYNGNYLVCRASSEDLHDDYPCSAALSVWATRDLEAERELPTMEVSSHGVVGSTRYGGSGASRHDRYRRRR